MTPSIPALGKHRLSLAAVVILLAAVLTAGTLFAASERSQPELPPLSDQSVSDATDPGLAVDLPVAAEAKPETPPDEHGAGVNQVVPNSGGSEALHEWLDEQPDVLGPYTVEDAMAASYRDVDWMLYEMVHKDVMTQAEADAFRAWFEQRPSVEEAPELSQYQPAYLGGSSNAESLYGILEETQTR